MIKACVRVTRHARRRWLDRNEDDGQIVRELLPFSDGQRLYSQ